MAHEMALQPLPQVRPGRKLKYTAVVNQSDTAIAPLQWNKPTPPAAAHQLIRCPLPHGPARFGKVRSGFPDVGAIEIKCIPKTRPDRMYGVGVQCSIQFKLPCNQGIPSTRINNPARGHVADLVT